MTQPAGENVTFTMKIDASDLRRLFASNGGPGPGGPPIPQPADPSKPDSGMKGIFKPLAVLYGIEKIMGGILKNSTIANTYMGAMGKMFGAAIDILLIPFIPLFNLLMVGISKLIMWLVTSGYLEKMTKIMEEVAKNIATMVKWFVELLKAIKDLDLGKVMSLTLGKVDDVVKYALSNPTAAAATVGTTALSYLIARQIPVLGGVIKMGERMIGFGGKSAAPAGGGGVPMMIGAGGGAARAGTMAAVGGRVLPALGAGYLAYQGAGMLADLTGVQGTGKGVLKGTAGGAVAGAMIGSVLLPGPGTLIGGAAGGVIGAGLGFMGSKRSQQQQQQQQVAGGGVSMVNSNNVINFTQNNTFMGSTDMGPAVNQAIDQVERRTGYVLAGRSSPQTARAVRYEGGAGFNKIGAAAGAAGSGIKKAWGWAT